MSVRRRSRQHGLTMIEVMMALLVFSIVAAASVYTLRLGVDARDQLTQADDTLKDIQLARILIKEDLAQAVVRTTRDEFGVASPSPFQGGRNVVRTRIEDDERILVSFTRAGWINPRAAAPRSALQYVEYVLVGDEVIRRARIYLDDAGDSARQERVLFRGVEDAQVEFLSGEFRGELEWATEWPLPGAARAIPRAVAVTVNAEGLGELRQFFWIGEVG